MTLLVLGISHQTAPIAVLDGLALSTQDAAGLARQAVQSRNVSEAMVLATCNRLEIVADVDRFHASTDYLLDHFAKAVGQPRAQLSDLVHVHYGQRAANYIFEVAAGLQSMVLGEQQIVGQVRTALRTAQELGTASRRLNAVTQAALRSAKRVHAETDIDRQGSSVVSVGLSAVEPHLPGGLSRARVLLVGAGAMSSLAAATLAARGVGSITIVNRSEESAARLVETYGGRAATLAALPDELAQADLVICGTGSADVIVTERVFRQARIGTQPVCVLDLAMPHDSDPELALLPGVTRLDLSDLAAQPAAAASQEDLDRAREVVAEDLTAYLNVEAARRLDPLVVSLRARAGEVVAEELARLRMRVDGLTAQQWEQVEAAMNRATATLLHAPTVRVKELAAEPEGQQYANALHSLFDLPGEVVSIVSGDLTEPGEAMAEDSVSAGSTGSAEGEDGARPGWGS